MTRFTSRRFIAESVSAFFLKSVNIWHSYKQEHDCLVHFLRLLAVCWPGASGARATGTAAAACDGRTRRAGSFSREWPCRRQCLRCDRTEVYQVARVPSECQPKYSNLRLGNVSGQLRSKSFRNHQHYSVAFELRTVAPMASDAVPVTTSPATTEDTSYTYDGSPGTTSELAAISPRRSSVDPAIMAFLIIICQANDHKRLGV